MISSRLKSVFHRAFPGQTEIDLETQKNDMEKWDSVGHLVLVLELEKEYGLRFKPEQMEKMRSVASVVDVLESLGVSSP
jgi:acyl carrier protein